MSQHANNEEIQIKALLEAWADAVRRHDITAILAHHEPDMVMFDLPPPLQCKGIEAYRQTWDLFFRYHKPGAAFDIQELTVTAGQEVAFAVTIMRCGPDSSSNPADKDGFLFRLTVGLRKVDGDWRIAHEHHSVPAMDQAVEAAWIERYRQLCDVCFDELDKVVEELKQTEKVNGRKKTE